jgi:hypothetical protein
MTNGTLLRAGAPIAAFLLAFGSVSPAAWCQRFARRSMECVSLECAADGKPYSFDSLPEAQEPGSTPSSIPKPPTSRDFVRVGEWAKAAFQFCTRPEGHVAVPVKVAQGHYWLPTAIVTGGDGGTDRDRSTDDAIFPADRRLSGYGSRARQQSVGRNYCGSACIVLRCELAAQGFVRSGDKFAGR